LKNISIPFLIAATFVACKHDHANLSLSKLTGDNAANCKQESINAELAYSKFFLTQ
jgi:hypothetical protein